MLVVLDEFVNVAFLDVTKQKQLGLLAFEFGLALMLVYVLTSKILATVLQGSSS